MDGPLSWAKLIGGIIVAATLFSSTVVLLIRKYLEALRKIEVMRQAAIGGSIRRAESSVADVRQEVDRIKEVAAEIKLEGGALRTNLSELRSDVQKLKNTVQTLEIFFKTHDWSSKVKD